MQVYISRLRRELRTSAEEVEVHRREPGYLLEIDPQRIDLHRFEQLTQAGLGALPDTPEIAVARLTAALDLWRGSPLSEFSKEPFAGVEIARLEEQHLTVLTARAEAELALGRHAELVGRLEQLLTEHPFHEGLQRQLMLSLYRSGRQTEALQAYQRMRRTFVDELGIEPGRELQALEKAILNQDPQINPNRPRSMGAADTEPSIQLWVMPPRNAHFTGRSDVLTQLKVQFNQSTGTLAVQALYGLGGVGKTELAIEYAHRFAHDYDIIWWIDAGQPALIPEQLCRLAVRLGVPDRGVSVETVDRVLTELASRPRWLIIFDNADRPEEIAQYRPAGTGHFLVTSRRPRWGALGGRIEVDVLDRLETITLLQRWVPRLPNNLAAALAKELGDLPLAAAQVAAYLEQTGLSAVDYLRRFRTQRASLLAEGEVLGYQGRIATTWLLSLQQLRAQDPATVSLLQFAAFLAPEPIPLTLFTDHADLLDEPLRTTALAGGDAVGDAVGTAVGYSLAHRYSDSFQLHRLVQRVIQDQLPAQARQTLADQVVDLLAAAYPGDPNDPRVWPSYAALTPHVLAAYHGHDHSVARQLMLAIIEYLNLRGDTRASRRIAEDVFRRWTNGLGPDHPDTITAAASLTSALTWFAEHDQALALSQDTLSRAECVLGADHPVTLHVATNLTFALAWLGQSRHACRLGQEALKRSDQALGAAHLVSLRLGANLTFALVSEGLLDTADRVGESTLQRCRQVAGAEHPVTLVAAMHLALTRTSLGQLERAHALGSDTLGRSRVALGADHPITLAASTHLAFVLTARGQTGQAKDLGQQTLERCRLTLGGDHLITWASAAVLALILALAGDPGSAHDLGCETLQRSTQLMGPYHFITLIAATAVVHSLVALGEYDQAMALAETTMQHAKSRYSQNHPIITLLTDVSVRITG